MATTPRLELRHLILLAALADAPSMAVAAQLLGLTQSALSHRLREAERRLATPLFLRTTKGLVLTPAGDRLLLTARRLLQDQTRAESDVAQIAASGATAVGRLAQGLFAAMPWYADFYRHCADELPDLQLEVVADATERPLELLAEGALDMALIAGESWRPGIKRSRAFTDSLVAVFAPQHAWRKKCFITPDDVASETFLSANFTITPGFEHQRFMQPAGRFPKRVIKVGKLEALLELVAAGIGVAIQPAWPLKAWIETGHLETRPLGNAGLPLDWHCAIRDSDDMAAPGPRLAKALVRWCAKSQWFSQTR